MANASLPEGETDVRLPDGAVWQFRFAKEFCIVALSCPLGVKTGHRAGNGVWFPRCFDRFSRGHRVPFAEFVID